MPEPVSRLLREHGGKGYILPRSKIWLFPTTRPNELLCNCTRIVGADGRELNTLFARDFTDAEVEGRLQVREYARFFRDQLVGCENAYVVDTGVQVGVRQTRQARGVATLANADILAGRKFADGHRPLAVADRAPFRRQAARRVAARRLVRSALRLLRAAPRRRPPDRRPVPVRPARGGRLGAGDGAVLFLRPGDRSRGRPVPRVRHRAARTPRRGGPRRPRPQRRAAERRSSCSTLKETP